MICVAIDIEHTRQTRAGTARYSTSLIRALSAIADIEATTVGGGSLLTRGTLRKRLVTAKEDFLWYPWLGRRRARTKGANIYHCPTPRAPLTRGKLPLVVTIHDLVQIHFPGTMTPWSRLYSHSTMRHVLRSADIFVTPSQDTANDLNTLLRVAPERIRVVWNGVDEIFFSAPPAFSLPTPAPISPYVLFVGTPEPRKNLPALLAAMEILAQRGFPHRLVIAGGGGWGGVDLSGRNVDVMGRVSDETLHALYGNAVCLVLPSLHEGFGLPAVEAMASGTPVVAAARGALPEITGNAAVLVDPADPKAIALGIERTISERAQLVAAGKARAAEFTWAKTAAATAAVYREL